MPNITNYDSIGGRILSTKTGSLPSVNLLDDALGSVTATSLSTSATASDTYRYLPYGGTLSRTGTRSDPMVGWVGSRGYRNNYRTSASHYVRARNYDVRATLWTSTDLLWPREAAFTYGRQNPATLIDPTGHLVVPFIIAKDLPSILPPPVAISPGWLPPNQLPYPCLDCWTWPGGPCAYAQQFLPIPEGVEILGRTLCCRGLSFPCLDEDTIKKWFPNAKGAQLDVARKCILDHEQFHADQGSCPNQDFGYKTGSRADECRAHEISLECLSRKYCHFASDLDWWKKCQEDLNKVLCKICNDVMRDVYHCKLPDLCKRLKCGGL